MADKTFLGGAALDVAIKAETHVDFVHRHYSVHGFDRPMAFLASNAGPDMRLVDEPDEIRQRVHPVPANLEWWLTIVGPSTSNRLDPAEQGAAMASDTSFDGRNSGHFREPRIFVAVLAGDFVDACMNTMTEGNRLVDIGARRPRPLRKGDRDHSAREQEQCDRDQ